MRDSGDPAENWSVIARAVAAAQRTVLDRVEAAGVPAPWFATLHILLNSPDHRYPMSRIARELSMTSGGFTKLVDRLGREGLVDRRSTSADRRVIFVVLTPKGLSLAKRAAAAYVAAVREHVVDLIPEKQIAEVAGTLRVLGTEREMEPDLALDEYVRRDRPAVDRRHRSGPARTAD